MRSDNGAGPPFRSGAAVPRSAKYAGIHEGHHLPFQMMHLFGGERFPQCPECGDAVTYVEVIRSRRRERVTNPRPAAQLYAV